MTTYFGVIDVYFANVLSPKQYAGKRLMNLKGSFGKAILWFLPEGSSLPDNRKPVHFNYLDTRNTAQIYTGDEPVGEEET